MRGPSKNRHAITILVTALLATRVAGAEAPRLETPPDADDCPSATELRQAIASQLGRDDFDRADAPSVAVRVSRAADGSFAADVSVTTHAPSTRTIDNADTCSDLVRAAALSIALAIEKDAVERKPPPPPPPPMTNERQEPPRGLLRNDRVAITASALTSIGLLPRPAAGGGAAVRVRVSDTVWISARGFWLPEASMPNDSFTMRLLAGGAGACIEPIGTTHVAAAGCGHVVPGSFDVTKANVGMRSTEPEAYVAATLSAGVRARLYGPIHLEGAADAQMPFTRPTYLTTTCPPTGFEPPFVALALWLGAGVSVR